MKIDICATPRVLNESPSNRALREYQHALAVIDAQGEIPSKAASWALLHWAYELPTYPTGLHELDMIRRAERAVTVTV